MSIFRSFFRSLREPVSESKPKPKPKPKRKHVAQYRVDSAEGSRTQVENPPDHETILLMARDPALQKTFAQVLRGDPLEDWGSSVALRR